jgi:hypothetical protein
MNYVFPASVRSQLSVAVALQLEAYLRTGNTDFELVGLDAAPLFITRAGSGIEGDESTSSGAQVVYPDDLKDLPGVPTVCIVSVTPQGSPDDWGDEEVSQIQVGLGCKASEFQAVVTEGAQPGGSAGILSDAVWDLVSHFDAMHEAGFVNANAVPGALEVEGLDYDVAISISFEVYVSKT